MAANTEITELIRSELCRFLQDACAGKTGVKLDMDNPGGGIRPIGLRYRLYRPILGGKAC